MLEILQTWFLTEGALPTALKCTVTFGLGNSPAAERAEAASRGSEVRIMDDAIVRGRSGSCGPASGIALALSDGVLDLNGLSDGDDILPCLCCRRYGCGMGSGEVVEQDKAADFPNSRLACSSGG